MAKKIKMNKHQFVGDFLNRRMKNHNLPYGMTYLNLLAKTEELALRSWNRFKNKNKKII